MSATLIDFLVQQKVLTLEHVRFAEEEGKEFSSSFAVKQLVAAELINETNLANFLGNKFQMPVVKLTNIDPEAVKLVPIETIEKCQCLPFKIEENKVHVALADPTRQEDWELIKSFITQPIVPVIAPFSNLEAAIGKVTKALTQQSKAGTGTSGRQEFNTANMMPQMPHTSTNAQKHLHAASSSHSHAQMPAHSTYPVKKFTARDPVPSIINEVLAESIAKGASDIHIEAQDKKMRVRFRIEGSLFDVYQIPLELKDQLCSRIKVLAGLDISERKIPQDGRIKLQIGKSDCHFRLNIIPAIHGESIALRVAKAEEVIELSKIGFDKRQLETFRKAIGSPNGMVLVTGPTGCGKTTTLYSALGEINRGTEKIATVEDPVEYNLDGIIQVQVNNETGLTFAAILKALLRQDPDVLLVGEIRDQETALIAVQAALSGHLVLSTLHTNDAPSAILRLLNMGMEPFMVLTSVSTVVAQRLLRRICHSCKQEVRVSSNEIALLGDDSSLVKGARFYRGAGCPNCLGGGYKGRAAAHEVLELTPALKEMLLKGENPVSFKRKAIELGMTTLRQCALRLVAAGETTLEEAVASTAEK